MAATSTARAAAWANSRCRSAAGSRPRSGSSTSATARRAWCTTSGALIVAALTASAIVLGLWLIVNPWLSGEPVGGAFFNLILLGYGIPAVLAIWLAMATRGVRPQSYRVVAAVFAVLLMLSYLTLEVRTLYPGAGAVARRHVERRAIHLFGGVARLTASCCWRSASCSARSRRGFASALITLLTIGKVFLLDMAGLTGVYRALSFIGLGLVLVSIGWLYQRLLVPAAPQRNGGARCARSAAAKPVIARGVTSR